MMVKRDCRIYKRDKTKKKTHTYTQNSLLIIIRVFLINFARKNDGWNFLDTTNIETNILDQNDQVYFLQVQPNVAI